MKETSRGEHVSVWLWGAPGSFWEAWEGLGSPGSFWEALAEASKNVLFETCCQYGMDMLAVLPRLVSGLAKALIPGFRVFIHNEDHPWGLSIPEYQNMHELQGPWAPIAPFSICMCLSLSDIIGT